MKQFGNIFRFTAIIALLVLSSHHAYAQHAPVKKIKGMVIDSASTKQIPNATITFTASNGNPGVNKTKTITAKIDGRFKIRLNHNYFWDMTVSAPGYESKTWKAVNSHKEYKRVLVVFQLKKAT